MAAGSRTLFGVVTGSRLVLARVVATLALAAALAGVAVVTVDRAGCDDPGRYEVVGGAPVYVPGCLLPDGAAHLPVAPDAPLDRGPAAADLRRG